MTKTDPVYDGILLKCKSDVRTTKSVNTGIHDILISRYGTHKRPGRCECQDGDQRHCRSHSYNGEPGTHAHKPDDEASQDQQYVQIIFRVEDGQAAIINICPCDQIEIKKMCDVIVQILVRNRSGSVFQEKIGL